jgi:hypothetical protein
MDAVVFRAALRASAKVALTATLSSCGGALQTTSGEGPDALADATPVTTGDEAAQGDAVAGDDAVAWDATVDAVFADAIPEASVFATTEGGACTPPPVASLFPEDQHPGVRISDTLFDCCVAFLGSALRLDGGAFQATEAGDLRITDAEANDPTFAGCCAVTVYRLDMDYGVLDSGVRDSITLQEAGISTYPTLEYGCCYTVPGVNGLTCTPWGPPMPPAMPGIA